MPERLILHVRDALVAFGKKPLFENLEFSILEGDKIALVGKNGAGKTTLMNVITGARTLDDGDRWQLEGTTIGYLQQDIPMRPGQSVRDFVREHVRVSDTHEAVDYRIDAVLHPLDLDPDWTMDTMSGGQLRRAALARALVEDPDILLLDEPTNHLDLDIIEWLENYLKNFRGAVLCVSHDRTFLANMSDKVFWLDRGRMRVCPKGFSDFEDWQTALIEQEARELKNRQKWLEMEEEWASRGVPARRKRNQKRLEMMRAERARLKADLSSYRRMIAKVELEAGETEIGARLITEFTRVHKSFGEKKILDGFSLRIMRGDRIGILGRNGSGKTTFLKLLVDEMKPDAGTIKRARDINISYFDQQRKDMRPDWSLWRTLLPNGGDYITVMGKTRHVCGYLKDFLFDPADAMQAVGSLSGGQKNRLMLARVLANPGNFLILDEPTNDLDMETLDMLEEVLSAYAGTLIVVSHDRDFLDQTVSKIIAFEGDAKIEMCIGGYSDYLEMKKEQKAPQKGAAKTKGAAPESAPASTSAASAASPARAAKLSYKLQYELDNLPEKIAGFEDEIATLTKKLQDNDFYMQDKDGFAQATRYLERAKKNLDAALARWVALEDMKGG
ncbi:MAG: ATP-binding cassette domain-containing protein [Rhodospirillales bacterium]|nr:ATP-binding cassette domain-containing protein [Alphaproteobacteria bacterium]MCB9986715.1 ATP-binding cassette domain-containing protein [Rhodospirillales bacterium]USO08515.1 MAG: ATP-binding cassette domain-containing protein [Rhodospirillales bacterium]